MCAFLKEKTDYFVFSTIICSKTTKVGQKDLLSIGFKDKIWFTFTQGFLLVLPNICERLLMN